MRNPYFDALKSSLNEAIEFAEGDVKKGRVRELELCQSPLKFKPTFSEETGKNRRQWNSFFQRPPDLIGTFMLAAGILLPRLLQLVALAATFLITTIAWNEYFVNATG
ncbi:hypothetical protein QWJ34_26350 [Saccharibacillus sp. CPCC 101409]|uniref:hypothetical protein n=1 Tax=Saccharibacillus sp. CPCC 101409 TaxID=3058041 RepID=UPI002670F69B|nr:hypothetical protein [Saccharibacillus sp. CPCC 101409]MDO3413301.1 hypothetical protein [Saccharibacillus sp. CPCC 101409]